MKDDQEAMLVAFETWCGTLEELIRHLRKSDKKGSSDTVFTMFLQGLAHFGGPDGTVMTQFAPVLNVIKKRVHAEDFEGALRQALSFRDQLEEVRLLVREGLESRKMVAKPTSPHSQIETSAVFKPHRTAAEWLIASAPAEWLGVLPDIQGRIDDVARDLISGNHVYAAIDPMELGELLGLDWRAPEEEGWTNTGWGFRRELPDDSEELAELIPLLEGKIPLKRFKKLEGIADQILDQGVEMKLPLTKSDRCLLEDLYSRREAPNGNTFGLSEITLFATDGTALHFQTLIGDSGDLEDQAGPYEHSRGEFFDKSGHIEIDVNGVI